MDDWELLELAAKAAGISPAHWGKSNVGWYQPDRRSIGHWNPLTDDGDALRLAVKLVIDIRPPRTKDDDAAAVVICRDRGTSYAHQGKTISAEAVTRRAIVVEAAKIGAQQSK